MTKILIIDDDPSLQRLYIELCQKHGWEFETASNGVEGIEKLKETKPDIILLDVLMPTMSGINFLKEVKRMGLALPATIVMTNSQVPQDTGELAKSLGAKSYSVKANTKLDEIVEMVKLYTKPQP